MKRMKVGSLFSGAGLGDLGWMMAGYEIAFQVEIDDYCQKILKLRFPESEKYYDIKTFKGKKGSVDIVAGGFPCQPFSVAGNQRGDQDDRNLWPEMFRIIKEIRPTWVVGENVSGIIPIYLDTILNDLESIGYATRTFVFPAHALGASHRRERIWIVGYAEHNGRVASQKQRGVNERGYSSKKGEDKAWKSQGPDKQRKDVADTIKHGKRGAQRKKADKGWTDDKRHNRNSMGDDFRNGSCLDFKEYWSTEPSVGRVVNGMPRRVDRLKALGNGQVVACTAFIGQQIMEFEK